MPFRQRLIKLYRQAFSPDGLSLSNLLGSGSIAAGICSRSKQVLFENFCWELSMRKRPLNRSLALGIGIGMLVAGALSTGASAQLAPSNAPAHGAPTYWSPESNMQKPANVGIRVHTNVIGVLLPHANVRPSKPSASGGLTPQTAPLSGYYYETPSSLACVYGFVTQTTGCNPANPTAVITSSGGQAIAIVDAYHNPSAASDLATFASQFGLKPPPNFQVIYATGVQPPADTSGWSLESSLDVEWAYAMSPN